MTLRAEILALGLAGTGAAFAQSFWVAQTPPSASLGAPSSPSVQFFGIAKGWALDGRGHLLKTSDGGGAWIEQTFPATNLNSMSFLNADTGWVSTTGPGRVYRTGDGGATWQLLSTLLTGRPVITFVSADTGWAVGQNIAAYKTVDGGLTWTGQNVEWGTTRSLFFRDGTGWVLDAGYLYKSAGGANSWSQMLGHDYLRGAFFVNRAMGWVFGDNGGICRTTDGGISWTAQPSGTTRALRAAYFMDASTGWMVGDSGTSLKTSNGGALWTSLESGRSDSLAGIWFENALTGWAMGSNGIIFRTQTADPASVPGRRGEISRLVLSGTRLSYHLDGAATVRISLRGVEGRWNALLFNGPRSAGTHVIDLPGAAIPSGIYLLDFRDGRSRTIRTVFLP